MNHMDVAGILNTRRSWECQPGGMLKMVGPRLPHLGSQSDSEEAKEKTPLISWQPRLLCTWSRWCCMEKVTPDQKIRAEQNSAACKVSMTAGISPDIESPSLQRRCGSRNRDIRFAIWAQYPKYLVFFVWMLFFSGRINLVRPGLFD